jgi:alkaline phosphatase
MKTRTVLNLLLAAILIVTGCSWTNINKTAKPVKGVKNIILFIGDGMGVDQLYAGMTVSTQPFALRNFPFSGFSITYSADNYITDSAAGGTAIACGIKTNNGMIGVAPDKSVVSSILEIAHRNGLATGIVSTSSVTHATPASFISHNSGRGNYEEIAKDFLSGNIDLFIGGGEDNFRKRADGKDLTIDLKNQGFDVVYTLDELKASGSVKIAGLLAKEHMPKASNGREGKLEEITKKAIETLSKDKDGFFLIIEGSMIDWGAHEKNIDYVTSETIDFDNAIGTALRFAEKKKGTLIVVTADHETGGLTLTKGSVSDHNVTANFSTGSHTAIMVPVFSFGPGSEIFSGIHDNTFFFGEFMKLLKLK